MMRKRLTHLPRPPTKHLPEILGPLDELLRADDDAAHGRAQPFRQTDADAVEAGTVLLQIDALGDDAVKEPRAVQMHGDGPLALGHGEAADKVGDLARVFEREDGAAEGVFERDDARWGEVDWTSISIIDIYGK